MHNVRLRLSYEGTNYGGFQRQKNAVTVQQKLEEALFQLYHLEIKLTVAGRTDSGVHALGQAVNYKTGRAIPVNRVPWALNTFLPEDIVVWEAVSVPDDFCASRDAVSKIYSYTIDNATFIQVLRRRFAWHCSEKLNLDKMRQGCRILEGKHDFRVFKATGSEVKDTVRTIFRAEVESRETENLIVLRVEGEGFLYKMVRFIAGALVELGKDVLTLEDLKKALQGNADRVGPALPPKGLCLEKVNYRV